MHPPEADVQGGVSVRLPGHAQRDNQLLVDPHRPDPVKVAELIQLGHVFELLGGRQRCGRGPVSTPPRGSLRGGEHRCRSSR